MQGKEPFPSAGPFQASFSFSVKSAALSPEPASREPGSAAGWGEVGRGRFHGCWAMQLANPRSCRTTVSMSFCLSRSFFRNWAKRWFFLFTSFILKGKPRKWKVRGLLGRSPHGAQSTNSTLGVLQASTWKPGSPEAASRKGFGGGGGEMVEGQARKGKPVLSLERDFCGFFVWRLCFLGKIIRTW